MDKLRARFPHILTLEFRPAGVTADPRGYRERVAGRDDLAVAAEFVSHVRGGDPSAGECDLLEQAFTAVRVAQEAGALTMRPHRLAVTAFGAFAGAETGRLRRPRRPVPAARRDRRGQDHAARRDRVRPLRPGARGARQRAAPALRPRARPASPPRWSLRPRIGGRRLRITRRPEQDRPAEVGRRHHQGPGLDPPGGAGRRRRLDGHLRPASGEADREIADLMGMSAEQFFQVVLLPQGQFAQFLHARAQEKEALLQKLFGTDRFSQVEDWLADRRRATDKEVAAAARRNRGRPGSPARPGRRRRGPGVRSAARRTRPLRLGRGPRGAAAAERDGRCRDCVGASKADLERRTRRRSAQAEQLADRQRRRREALRQAAGTSRRHAIARLPATARRPGGSLRAAGQEQQAQAGRLEALRDVARQADAEDETAAAARARAARHRRATSTT